MAPTSIKNGANLAQGVGNGYPQINGNMNNRKSANANTQKKNTNIFHVRRSSQKTEGSTAGRLPMFYENKKKVRKKLYKTEHKETEPKQQMSQSPSKK